MFKVRIKGYVNLNNRNTPLSPSPSATNTPDIPIHINPINGNNNISPPSAPPAHQHDMNIREIEAHLGITHDHQPFPPTATDAFKAPSNDTQPNDSPLHSPDFLRFSPLSSLQITTWNQGVLGFIF
jgi:hypothetical protein